MDVVDKVFPRPETAARGPTKLVQAAGNGDIGEVRSVVKKYPDKVNITYGGFTALQQAAYYGHVEIVKYLCSHGADVDQVDAKKWTPLHYAVDGNQEDVVGHLLEMKANMDLKNTNEQTPLQLALKKKHQRCADLFYKIDPKLSRGETKPKVCAARIFSGSNNVGCIGGCGTKECVTFEPCEHKIYCLECSIKHKSCTQCNTTIVKVTFDPRQNNVKRLMQDLSKFRTENEKFKCSICEERNKDCALRPCSHVFCSECVEKLNSGSSAKKCPNCRKNVEDVIKLYM